MESERSASCSGSFTPSTHKTGNCTGPPLKSECCSKECNPLPYTDHILLPITWPIVIHKNKLKCTRSISERNKKQFHKTLQNKVTSDIQTSISGHSLPGIQLLSFTVSQHTAAKISNNIQIKKFSFTHYITKVKDTKNPYISNLLLLAIFTVHMS